MKKIIAILCGNILVSACGGGSGSPAATVDPSDPIEVAEAFFKAIDENEIDSAATYIHPDQVTQFVDRMSRVTPSLPDDYELVVMAQENEGEASIVGSPIEVGMVLEDERWWIIKK